MFKNIVIAGLLMCGVANAGPFVSGGTPSLKVRCSGGNAQMGAFQVLVLADQNHVLNAHLVIGIQTVSTVAVTRMTPVDPTPVSAYFVNLLGDGFSLYIDKRSATAHLETGYENQPLSEDLLCTVINF